MKLQLDEITDQARAAYRAGDYEAAMSLTGQIDAACKSLIVKARTGVLVCGAILGAILTLVLSRIPHISRRNHRTSLACILALPPIIAGCGVWAVTAASTRKEVLLAAGLGAAGMLLGWGVCGIMSAVGYQRREKAFAMRDRSLAE